MRAVQWIAPRKMELVEREKPSPAPHEALLRIESCGVCGSDIHYYLDGCIGAQKLEGPTVLGHEYAGVVEAVGSEADPSLVGKRVAVEPGIPCMRCEWCRTGHYNVCRDLFFPGGPGKDGAFSDYYCVHAGFCYPLPNTVRADEAAMLEPLAVAVHTVELAQLRPGETALVIGLGPIGLLTAQVLKHMGAQTLYGADLLEYRVEAGRRFGVDVAWNAGQEDTVARIMEETGGRGVDVAFDCSNRSEPLSQCVHAVRPAGRVVMTGISGEEDDPMPVSAARRKELTLQWCRRFCHNYPAAIAMLAAGSVDVRGLITHSFPLERTQDAFELVANYADNVLKASIDW